MKVSIVMAVYNGARFIKEQLDSVRMQTYTVDEVLILDDHSTDDSVMIIKTYISEYKLNHWKLIVNEKNQGWKKNFKHGFELASGDLIFPADQDDIWHIDKIEKMLLYMGDNKNYDLIASNYDLKIEGEGNRDHTSQIKMMNKIKPGEIKKIPFDYQWIRTRRPGCVFCFRKSFFKDILPLWDDEQAHDAQLWMFSCVKGKLGICGDHLIDFRRHGDNATEKDGLNLKSRIKTSHLYIRRIDFFSDYLKGEGLWDSNVKKLFSKQKKYEETRLILFKKKSIFAAAKLFFIYQKCYYTKRSMLGDFYFTFFKR